MKHITWISEQRNSGRSWEELKNITEDEFVELREYQGIIPRSIKNLDMWRAFLEEREKVYVERVKVTGISTHDSLELDVPQGVTSCWKAYKESLKNVMSERAIDDIENNTHWILNQLARKSGTRKGLVMGSVQSGKTANMVGLVSMAADYDWNFYIILSGSIDNLRKQTRDRFRRDLQDTDSVMWHVLDYGSDSDHLYDLRTQKQICFEELQLNALGNKTHAQKYVIVCLKQSGRLERLIKWLHGNESIASKLRLVVIDDEADQASINTKLMDNAVDEEAENDVERTKINQSVVNLVSNCLPDGTVSIKPLQSISYVSYTATPYANILNEKIEGYSLYPSDFIHSLPEPKAYFGEKVIFGSHSDPETYPGLKILRTIKTNELAKINSTKIPITSVPDGLKEAIKWFFCAAAVMRISSKKRSISMLIHTSPRVRTHMLEYKLVFNWLRSVDKGEFVSACQNLYEQEIQSFTKENLIAAYPDYEFKDAIPDALPSFDQISDDIRCLLSKITHISIDEQDDLEYVDDGIHLCVDNCIAQRYADEDSYMRIVYPDDETLAEMEKSPVFIVFGGNTLSRGLTIEGLVCTYFARNVTQADTLMQMARWFGYRKGYELLQRIWMSDETQKHFKLLQRIDEELKQEFNNFKKEKKSPKEFGPKILNSKSISKLRITAKNRMQAAIESGTGFNGDAFETTKFRSDDLSANITALEFFIQKIGVAPVRSEHSNAIIWHNVASGIVRRFISQYRHYDDKQERILKVIDDANSAKRYLNWNVAIIEGDSKTGNAVWEPFDEFPVRKSMRSKLKDEPDVDIDRLRNATDALCDVKVENLMPDQIAIFNDAMRTHSAINVSRGKLGLEDTPLLLLYRIDKDAPKESHKKNGKPRESIDTLHDVIAYAIIISGDGKDTIGPTTLSII